MDRLLRRLDAGRHDRSIIISGLRGVGKTVLLREIQIRAREAGWVTGDVQEARPEREDRAVFAAAARDMLSSLSTIRGLRDRLQRAKRILGSFVVAATDSGVEFRIDVNPERGVADSGDIEADLSQLLVEIGDLALSAGQGVLFLIDEMQFLSLRALEALAAAFHQISQRELPVALIGAGLPQIAGRLTQAKSYSERLFAYAPIERLSRSAAREALIAPAARLDVAYETRAVEYLIDRCDAYPYFLQEYGSEAWDAAEQSPIDLSVAEFAHERARASLDEGFFRARFEKGDPAERRYMEAMASLSRTGPYPLRDVAGQLGTPTSLRTATIDSMLGKGLIYDPHPGYVDFTVPQFGDFVRRKHPL